MAFLQRLYPCWVCSVVWFVLEKTIRRIKVSTMIGISLQVMVPPPGKQVPPPKDASSSRETYSLYFWSMQHQLLLVNVLAQLQSLDKVPPNRVLECYSKREMSELYRYHQVSLVNSIDRP